MNSTAKTITAAALLLAIIGIGYAVITAQPPTTVRTVPAAPQGEWVAIQTGTTDNMQYFNDGNKVTLYCVLYHTGTGKARVVKWPQNVSSISIIDSN